MDRYFYVSIQLANIFSWMLWGLALIFTALVTMSLSDKMSKIGDSKIHFRFNEDTPADSVLDGLPQQQWRNYKIKNKRNSFCFISLQSLSQAWHFDYISKCTGEKKHNQHRNHNTSIPLPTYPTTLSCPCLYLAHQTPIPLPTQPIKLPYPCLY